MKKVQKFVSIILLSSFASVAAYAGNWPYSDGVTVGCSMGQNETYVGENLAMHDATLLYALGIDEIDYHDGVMDGYEFCKYDPQQSPSPSPGVEYCAIDLSNPEAEEPPEWICGCSEPFCADQN